MSIDLAELAQRYQRDGFVHARGLLPRAEVEALAAFVDEAVARRKVNDTRALDEKSPYEQSFIQCQYVWEDFPGVGMSQPRAHVDPSGAPWYVVKVRAVGVDTSQDRPFSPCSMLCANCQT